ncbi:M23 family metallopeptidase [uncultured Mucilaginibacter sp.]|uniref:M23 family metallopeptidase n=1 Tax=uncultured Mucilaginibacter sp. TaxID=797541 RepID=UPI0025FA0051|nr:M23 family metallopeptidase [uncultured Mucilaginibacter sp.]
MNCNKYLLFLIALALFTSCSNKGPLAIFNKLTPHEAYAQRLKDAKLDGTAMGSKWLKAADISLSNALNIKIPYKETGYFSAEKVPSTAFRFDARRGQKLHVVLEKKPAESFDIYMDILQQQADGKIKWLASADTVGLVLDYEIKSDGKYLFRLQPELLRSGEYTLTITSGPSLEFPVSNTGKPNIGSFWGDGRDNGGRKHEGVDIFAKKLTPAIAAADGLVTNVTENNLGGLVVFMRPANRDYTLYYAHLDKQLVQSGQSVRTGDTLGLVGNTGNARNTPSHLHFGIYTGGGAIDPFPFVNRNVQNAKPVSASLTLLNATARTTAKNTRLFVEPDDQSVSRLTLPVSTVVSVEAATGGWYKATLPDGTVGYIISKNVTSASSLRKLTIKQRAALLDAPDTVNAARKSVIEAGKQVDVKGSFGNYYLVSDDANTGWIKAR